VGEAIAVAADWIRPSGLIAAFRSAPIGGDAVGVTAGVI
jgi:hypothetical protein